MRTSFTKRSVDHKREYLNSKTRNRLNGLKVFFLTLFLVLLIGGSIVGGALVVGAYNGIIDSAPTLSAIDVTPKGYSTFVYDNEGEQIAKLVSTDSNRIPVTSDQIPDNLKHAFVAIEDERFYEHNGIDVLGILRAGVTAIKTKSLSQGASTITQQLIKNSVFDNWTDETTSEKITRKIQEQYLAIQLEKTMSKDEILTNYMNIINLGHGTLGVQAASKRYFGKDVSKLTLSECAAIACITQNPSKYDPITYPENNNTRRIVVLDKMLEQGYITQEEHDEAVSDYVYERIQTVDSTTDDNKINSYFVDALTEQVLDNLQDRGYTENQAYSLLYSGGLQIYSTQDQEVQKIADEAANDDDLYAKYAPNTKWLLDYDLSVKGEDGTVVNYSENDVLTYMKNNSLGSSILFTDKSYAEGVVEKYKKAVLTNGGTCEGETINFTAQPQVSITIEDQHTGQVLAIVGGRGKKTANRTWNRATDTTRQPGSTFKVLAVYAPALDAAGKTLASVQKDEAYTYENGTPVRNWWGAYYRGWQNIRSGIRESMNIIAVKNLTEITPALGYEYLKDFGFTTLVENEIIGGSTYSDIAQPLALGGLTKGVKNIELNAAYAAIANGGVYYEPKLYTKVLDHDGNVILDASTDTGTQVIRPATAWLLTSAMEDVVTESSGTAKLVNFGTTAIAGKTGTTSDNVDEWFAGYTDYYTATVWTGYDENTHLKGTELSLAKGIWREVMSTLCEGKEYKDFEKPDNIVEAKVCKESGLLPSHGCPTYTEYFEDGTQPTQYCPQNGKYNTKDLNSEDGALDEPIEEDPDSAVLSNGMTVAEYRAYQANIASQLVTAQNNLNVATLSGDAATIAAAQSQYNTLLSQQAAIDEYNAQLAAAGISVSSSN